MHQRGFEIDAGSACSPEDLAPSHVIAVMGLPTNGHIRITLHPDHTTADIEALASALKEVLSTS
jgi:cysteine desulfurase